MTTTLNTLNSQLNTLLEQQASIIRQAEAFAESLELNSNMKELKKIAAEWNVVPANKTKKASYIAALHQAYAEKNGLTEVNEQIKKLQFQIKCAEAQECANATQNVTCVIRTIDQTWWVGTEETFHTIYPNDGYEIHFTARPEKPDTYFLTSNPSILMQDVSIDGTTYTIYGHDREELTQETLVLTEAVHRERPLQGVASFLSSLAIFSSHDILPLDVTDIDLYRELKAKWDDMNGDEKCQCEWCDAEPLQYQEQEELQHAEHLQEQLPTVEIRKDGTVGISTEHARLTISAREAYTLLSELYDKRDEIYKAAQQYAEKHLWEHLAESRNILYTVVTDRYALPVRYLLPDAITPEWFSPCKFSDPGEASQEFRAKYPDAEYISPEKLEEEYQKRDALLTENKKAILLGTGLLSWPREERISGRYGLVALFGEDWDTLRWQIDIMPLVGKYGTLVAVLDGKEIELGRGKCFTEQYYDNEYIGLRPPLDYLEEEWLSPTQLHKVDGHITHNPVELWFVEQ